MEGEEAPELRHEAVRLVLHDLAQLHEQRLGRHAGVQLIHNEVGKGLIDGWIG